MQNLIEEIKSKVGIMDLLSRLGIEVNKSGFIYSIYKTEKTPSLKIYPKSNSYYCFAANRGSDIIQFYEDYYNVDTSTAIRELAALFNITAGFVEKRTAPIHKVVNVVKDAKAAMTSDELDIYYERLGISDDEHGALVSVKHYRINNNSEIFNEFMNYCLSKRWNHSAYHYLTNIRKLDDSIIQQFKLFAIDNYHEVNNHLKKKFALNQLKLSGLYNENGNLIFYKHRIIIPYLNRGNVVYLRARYFDENGNHQTDSNKYMGLTNDALEANTARRFFNTDVLSTMLKGERLYLTEGEFDVMMLRALGWSAIGIPGVGNIPNRNKFTALKDFNIYLCLDQDRAGQDLQQSLKEIFWSMNKSVTIKMLPTKDVTDFVIEASGETVMQ